MKKVFLSILSLFLTLNHHAKADDDFFDNLIVDDELKQKIEQKDAIEEGKNKASEILDSKPIKLQIDDNLKLKMEELNVEQIAPVIREPAPFGLKWLATKKEIEYLHVRLNKAQVKDSPNSYIADNLPKPVKAFREVLLSFGENDALWRIAAYSNFYEDDSSATKGLEQYKKFYEMLNDKYGNAEEFYTPAVVSVEEEITLDDGTKSRSIKQKVLEMGEPGFKEKLMSGQSTLYSTFENDTIGVTLALLADGNGQTYIIIDYKNLKIDEVEKQEIYEAL